jgi:dephospho-CoA kinase
MALAAPLKEAVQSWFDFSADQVHGDSKDAIDPRYKLKPREVLQWIGTEGVRSLYPDVWADYLIRKANETLANSLVERITRGSYGLRITDYVVVTDVRFLNEARKIQEAGGQIWHVWRPGLAQMAHASERECDSIADIADVLIDNSSTLDALREQVLRHARTL